MSSESELLTTQQVSDELRIPVREVRKLIDLELLRAWRVGRRIRVPRSALVEFRDGGNIGSRAATS